jgi:hypothetical protein
MRKKTVKLTKKNLTICPDCGRPKVKDERVVTEERLALVNENVSDHDLEGVPLI